MCSEIQPLVRSLLAALALLPLCLVAQLEPPETPVPLALSSAPNNLILNPDAEQGVLLAGGVLTTPSWQPTNGFAGVLYGVDNFCGFASPSKTEGTRIGGGNALFFGGSASSRSTASQVISLANEGQAIDASQRSATLQAQLGASRDSAMVLAEYLSADQQSVLGTLQVGPVNDTNGLFQLKSATGAIPPGTRAARISMIAVDLAGFCPVGNLGYFDNLFFGLQTSARNATLLLSQGRISVTLFWQSQYNGQSGNAFVIPEKDEFGFFFFTDPNNPEVFVKVLDFGGGNALCFVGGLSDFYYKVTFATLRTGQTLVFEKKAGELGGFANGAALQF